jgi:GDP-L-fucose synthase
VLESAGYKVVALASVDADLRDWESTRDLFNVLSPPYVVHLAAKVGGLMGNFHAQGEMFLDNVRMNTNVIEASRLAGVEKIVAMGSVAVYPDNIELPMRESDIWQGAPHGSEAGYAHAKRSMLAQLDAYKSQFGLEFAFAVSTNLFGPNDRFDEVRGHVLPSLVSKFHRGVETGDDVVIWGTGSATRDFLFSHDAAHAIRVLLEHGDGVYNVASGSHVTIAGLVDELVDVSGFEGKVVWDRTKPDGQAARGYDITKLAALGWAPQVQFRSALEQTYSWYANNVASVRR